MKKASVCFYKPLRSFERRKTLTPMGTDHRADWRKKKICSCLQILLSCLSNKMSLSARWDTNFLSSLVADEQKGSPWDLIIWPWLLSNPLKKKKIQAVSGKKGNAIGSNLCTISVQTRSRHLQTRGIKSPQPGQDGEGKKRKAEPRGPFKLCRAGSHRQH